MGNVVCPSQYAFILQRTVRALARAAAARKDGTMIKTSAATSCHLCYDDAEVVQWDVPLCAQCALAADSQEDCKTATAARKGSRPIAAPPRMDSSSLIYNACKIGIKKYLKQKYENMDTHERGQLLTKFVHNAIDLLLPHVDSQIKADLTTDGDAEQANATNDRINSGIHRAIVDSGASSHFVTKHTQLENPRPSTSRGVAVASGRVEPIAEVGDKGPLKDLKKVNSFTRSLISVSALSELIGMVAFDGNKVYAVSSSGAKVAVSTIGQANKQGLYSFDYDKLKRHCEKHKSLLPSPGGDVNLMDAMPGVTADQEASWIANDASAAHAVLGDWGDEHHAFTSNKDGGMIAVAHACSDQDAAIALRKFHDCWGHLSTNAIALLFDQGIDIGADVSRDQILSVQFWCEACNKSRFDRKRYNKKGRKKPPPKVKCGEWLVMDIIERKVTSHKYIDGTGKARGGGKYTLYTLCEASGRAFEFPVNKKSDVEQAVRDTIAHIEIQMRRSCDFDGGGTAPKVLRITSDRDANITSYKSVVHLLEQRVEQVLTASHAKNQTPRLDGAIRRLLTTTTSLLTGCGLDMQYWEHAQRFAVSVENHTPTKANVLGRSPMHRWLGVPPQMSIQDWHAFGSDASVHLRVEQREGGDKMGARSKGGGGRYRYFGPDCMGSRGTSSKGAILYDTQDHRMAIMRNYEAHSRREKLPLINQTENPETKSTEQNDSSGGGESKEEPSDEVDRWNQLYTTTSKGETYARVARHYRIDLEELLNHNEIEGRPPRPGDKMVIGTELWLPDAATHYATAPTTTKTKTDPKLDLAGRLFERVVTGFGKHFGVVIEGRDGKGRYRVLYGDGDGVYHPKYLRQDEISKGLLPKGTPMIHVEQALKDYDDHIKELAAEEEAQEKAYAAHVTYVKAKQTTGELPDASKAGVGDEDTNDAVKPYAVEAMPRSGW